MTNKIFHLITVLVFIILLSLLSDSLMLWMPASAQMPILLGAVVLVGLWTGLIMYEEDHDEREATHKLQAGRAAYLSGIIVLTVALIYQGLGHHIDPWILLTLGTMVVVKLATRLYSERYL